MRRSVGHSLGVFAALALAAEARAMPQPISTSDTVSLAEKLEVVRALAPAPQQQRDLTLAPKRQAATGDPSPDTSQLQLLPGMRLAQWFNWGNWRNCANGNC